MSRSQAGPSSATRVSSADACGTLRKLYAPAWKPWTPLEAVDRKMGAASEKARNGAPESLPHNPLVPGFRPGGGIRKLLTMICLLRHRKRHTERLYAKSTHCESDKRIVVRAVEGTNARRPAVSWYQLVGRDDGPADLKYAGRRLNLGVASCSPVNILATRRAARSAKTSGLSVRRSQCPFFG